VSEPERFKARVEANAAPGKIDSTPEILLAMIDLARDARTITDAGREHFFAEVDGRLFRHAADAILVKFQELCERLPESTRKRHPSVPWQEIRSMRNRLGHHYRSTDYRVLWTAIERDLVEVVDDLSSELE
jgi:uncharacterized protein with HEPN domain